MRCIEQTDKYVVDSEQAAVGLIQAFRNKAEEEGFRLGASGYTYKSKKSKGEIADEAWVVSIKKIFGGVWDGE